MLKEKPRVINTIQKWNIPNCRTSSSFTMLSGKICSVKNIQTGKESPAIIKVDSKVLGFNFTLSIRSPLIPKIKAPANPERSPGKIYLSKSKLIAVRTVIKNIAVVVKTITKVKPTFFFNGPSILTSGSPRAKSNGTKKSKPVQKEIRILTVASIKFTKIVSFFFEIVMISLNLLVTLHGCRRGWSPNIKNKQIKPAHLATACIGCATTCLK